MRALKNLTREHLCALILEIQSAEATGHYAIDSPMRELAQKLEADGMINHEPAMQLFELQIMVLREAAFRFAEQGPVCLAPGFQNSYPEASLPKMECDHLPSKVGDLTVCHRCGKTL